MAWSLPRRLPLPDAPAAPGHPHRAERGASRLLRRHPSTRRRRPGAPLPQPHRAVLRERARPDPAVRQASGQPDQPHSVRSPPWGCSTRGSPGVPLDPPRGRGHRSQRVERGRGAGDRGDGLRSIGQRPARDSASTGQADPGADPPPCRPGSPAGGSSRGQADSAGDPSHAQDSARSPRSRGRPDTSCQPATGPRNTRGCDHHAGRTGADQPHAHARWDTAPRRRPGPGA